MKLSWSLCCWLMLAVLPLGGCSGMDSMEEAWSQGSAQFPLSRDDPRSRLEPGLLAVPVEPYPAARKSAQPLDPQRAERAVRFTPATGQEVVREVEITAAGKDLFAPGALGELPREGLGSEAGDGVGRTRQEVIFDSDDRRLVPDSLGWPARAFVKIYVTWPNGAGGGCSGSLIGRKYVLTAGHCVYNPDKGGWAASTRVIPGLDGTYMPFGEAYQVYYDSVTGWTEDQNNDYDYAMVTLNRNLGDATGWFGLASLSDGTLDGMNAAIQGYPGDLSSGTRQYVATGNVQTYDSTMIYYRIDTMPGDSGAGFRGTSTYPDHVAGVHTGDSYYWLSHYNRATRINSTRFNLILGWMGAHAGLPTVGGDFTYWSSLGGLTYHTPIAVSWGPDRYDLFVRGLDGVVHHKARTASGFTPSQTSWEHIGGSITDVPAAVSRAANQLDLFVRGTDGGVWTKALNGSTWWPAGAGWYPLGGNILGAPSATSWASDRLDVFARDAGGGLVWAKWSGSTGWSSWTNLGGDLSHPPAAKSWGWGRIDVVARNSAGNLVHNYYSGSYLAGWRWSGWRNLGGYLASAPTLVSSGSGRLHVFVRGGDNAVWQRTYSGSTWTNWESLGGNITDEIAAVSRLNGQVDLFVRDMGGAIFTKAWNSSAGWWPSQTGWAWLGGDMLGAPGVVSFGPNRLDVFGRGSDNGIRTRWWDGSRWWL